MNRAGNAINHPETIQPDPHSPGAPLPRANLHNSIGYLPDGTPMNRAGNAINHPETIQPDMHTPGSPLPKSVYAADVGYLVDGTDLRTAGNNSVKAAPPAAAPSMPVAPPVAAPAPVAAPTPVAASFTSSSADALHGIKFSYSMQKDAYADLEFVNDVGCLEKQRGQNMEEPHVFHPGILSSTADSKEEVGLILDVDFLGVRTVDSKGKRQKHRQTILHYVALVSVCRLLHLRLLARWYSDESRWQRHQSS